MMAIAMKGKRMLVACAVALAIIAGDASVVNVAQAASQVVAVVNKTAITNGDVSRRVAFLRLQRRKGNLNEIAKQELVEETLKRQEIARSTLATTAATRAGGAAPA